MQIREVRAGSTVRHHRFIAVLYECEACGHESPGYAFHDEGFYEKVLPTIACSMCSASSVSPAPPRASSGA